MAQIAAQSVNRSYSHYYRTYEDDGPVTPSGSEDEEDAHEPNFDNYIDGQYLVDNAFNIRSNQNRDGQKRGSIQNIKNSHQIPQNFNYSIKEELLNSANRNNKLEIEQKLLSMDFNSNHIAEAFRTYEKNYGRDYRLGEMIDILVGLSDADLWKYIEQILSTLPRDSMGLPWNGIKQRLPNHLQQKPAIKKSIKRVLYQKEKEDSVASSKAGNKPLWKLPKRNCNDHQFTKSNNVPSNAQTSFRSNHSNHPQQLNGNSNGRQYKIRTLSKRRRGGRRGGYPHSQVHQHPPKTQKFSSVPPSMPRRSPTLLQDDMKETKTEQIPSLISTPFAEDNGFVECYLYHIQFREDPFNTPMAIVMPSKLDEHHLESITFPVCNQHVLRLQLLMSTHTYI